MRRYLCLTTSAFALAGMLAGTAGAQNLSAPPTKDVYFTFSQPVVVPNKTLPAGKYLFRLEGRDRHIVQIYSGDRAKLLHTASAVGSMRADQPERAEVRLIESAADAPVAIGSWWYPEMREGWEFIYPRQQANELAKKATEPILTTKADVSASEVESGKVESGDLVRLNPGGDESAFVASTESQPARPRGTAQIGEVSSDASTSMNQGNAAGSASGRTQASSSARAELPTTATHRPEIALMALIALAAAFALRVRRMA